MTKDEKAQVYDLLKKKYRKCKRYSYPCGDCVSCVVRRELERAEEELDTDIDENDSLRDHLSWLINNVLTDSQLDKRTKCGKTIRNIQKVWGV